MDKYTPIQDVYPLFSFYKISIKSTTYPKKKDVGSFTICFLLQCVAREHGLILVDTKYEFGKGRDGSILLIDEV